MLAACGGEAEGCGDEAEGGFGWSEEKGVRTVLGLGLVGAEGAGGGSGGRERVREDDTRSEVNVEWDARV